MLMSGRIQRLILVLGLLMGCVSSLPVMAGEQDGGVRGKVTGKTVFAGAVSLLIWPGLGQAINEDPGRKVGTHALLGLFPPYRLWSAYDAVVDRKGGYWHGKI